MAKGLFKLLYSDLQQLVEDERVEDETVDDYPYPFLWLRPFV